MIKEKIMSILAEELGVELDEIKTNSNIQEDLGADSLAVVEVIMAFEDEFDIKIPEEDTEKLTTVKDIVEYVESKIE
ncbi:acyl carrier protein [Alkalibaculum sp. M08DMB]|uniref:Acyl carrier protein n=1 Tax=Alkalibaculum sporogenes TaxID=2655001 RepID=A0A6A7KAL0_9FIRM|nr:acyl carrier protein [Alkalibaculum sporogenes]MPW26385.1 acyl carrier protein [Alkalibaculum sporogenes]